MPTKTAQALIDAAAELGDRVHQLRFTDPVHTVYNPLRYAWEAHRQYLTKYGRSRRRVVFFGMNPGPWGMAQTGVPFGEVETARDWLGITARIDKPENEHPKRPVQGLDCPRSEVSGQRIWGLFRERFGTPAEFFREHYVSNYCPLVFMEQAGRNRTPDKLPAAEREPLEAACDDHLQQVLATLRPEVIVGVGAFAEKRAQRTGYPVARILHPSPASPKANRGWAEQATRELRDQGIWP